MLDAFLSPLGWCGLHASPQGLRSSDIAEKRMLMFRFTTINPKLACRNCAWTIAHSISSRILDFERSLPWRREAGDIVFTGKQASQHKGTGRVGVIVFWCICLLPIVFLRSVTRKELWRPRTWESRSRFFIPKPKSVRKLGINHGSWR